MTRSLSDSKTYTAELTVAVAQWNVLESREGPLNSETIDEALARIIGE